MTKLNTRNCCCWYGQLFRVFKCYQKWNAKFLLLTEMTSIYADFFFLQKWPAFTRMFFSSSEMTSIYADFFLSSEMTGIYKAFFINDRNLRGFFAFSRKDQHLRKFIVLSGNDRNLRTLQQCFFQKETLLWIYSAQLRLKSYLYANKTFFLDVPLQPLGQWINVSSGIFLCKTMPGIHSSCAWVDTCQRKVGMRVHLITCMAKIGLLCNLYTYIYVWGRSTKSKQLGITEHTYLKGQGHEIWFGEKWYHWKYLDE